uniref:Uncharacterized protein n=1 Tax=Anguilla anguilla TaxID=7936 RepID=A0A0E9VZQ9_ANGAN
MSLRKYIFSYDIFCCFYYHHKMVNDILR